MSDTYMITPGEGGHIREELSAYIDGALGVAERESVHLHLEGCALCRTDYEELLATQNLLRSVPVVVPPRAFTLTEEMVMPARREGFWEKLLSPRNGSRLATGSVLSFALVVMLLVGNLGLLGTVNNIGSAVDTYDLSRLEESQPAGAMSNARLTPDASEKLQPLPAMPQGAAPTQTTAASGAWADASPQAMATNLPEEMAMAAEPTMTALATGMGAGLITPEVSAEVMATPLPPGDASASGAQATATEAVTFDRWAAATITALAGSDDFTHTDPGVTGAIQATAEASGRAPASKPVAPREVSPLLDEPSGDGRGIYYGLMVLFLALGVLLGLGALVARRRGSL
jgi:predicted anti-sigma-YlaC factor YlaD